MLKVVRPWTLKEPTAPAPPRGLPDNSPPHVLIVFRRQLCVLFVKAEPIPRLLKAPVKKASKTLGFFLKHSSCGGKLKETTSVYTGRQGSCPSSQEECVASGPELGRKMGGDCQGHTPCCGPQYHKPSASLRRSRYVRLCEPSLVTPSTQNPHHSG